MHDRRSFLAASTAVAVAPLVYAQSKPLVRLGLVADAQYADIDPLGSRHYRRSVGKLGAAVEDFNKRELDLCVHLGDLIDRKWESFDEIKKPLAGLRHPIRHLFGNHDFDVLDEQKEKVPGQMGLEKRYSFTDKGGFRLVFLDTTDVSTYAHALRDARTFQAVRQMNDLEGQGRPHAQPWNSAVGPEQMAWLRAACVEAAGKGLKVVLFGHHPVYPANTHNLWNDQEMMGFAEANRNVVAWINGHNHQGNFGTKAGVAYVTLEGMVETAETTAYSVADLYADRIVLTGVGRVPSRELVFRS
ncbi:MAG: phosphatase [Planctomycetota bacterium]|nr:MAG: phosphatase [Planctomycetota bacterium]